MILYIDAIKKLCENGLPVEKYFDLCANFILEYDLIRHGGIIHEISSEDNYKNESNSLKDNKNKDNNPNTTTEEKLKKNLEVKNESLKNN